MGDSFTHLHDAHRVLDARRCVAVERAGGGGRGRRSAGARHHRPRQHVRDPRVLQGVPSARASSRSSGPRPTAPTSTARSGRRRRGRIDDTGGDAEGGKKLYYHLTLLAETDTGYRNLIKLSSLAFLEGYYYKPRMDWELLEQHHEGLIATTGCLGGHVLQALLAGDDALALERAARLQDIFGRDNLFVELQDHGLLGPARDQPEAARASPEAAGPGHRHQRQPLHPPARPPGPRRAPVRADRRAA